MMRGGDHEVLYVGKARNLRNRLRSYVNYLDTLANKTGVLLSKVALIETTLTMTEKEALLLESSLIKKFKPRYNIILRDDKQYPYLKLTVDEEWPRLVVTRRKLKSDKAIFGPFSSASAMWETVKFLNQFFPLRRCKGKELRARIRPCLNFQMHKCLAPCAGTVDHQAYMQTVSDVSDVLSGKNQKVIARLQGEMEFASEALEFEHAAQLRDTIRAIQKTVEKQMVLAGHHRDQDVFGFVRQGEAVAISILRIQQGVVLSHENHFFQEPLDGDSELLSEFVQRFYEKDAKVPQEIFVPFLPFDYELLESWLSELRATHVAIKTPLRGDFVKLLAIAQKNAKQVFVEANNRRNSWEFMAGSLVRECGLRFVPNRITCMDISHISGTHTVGSAVSFFAGEKEAACYRHYKIQSVSGPDDYASMAELLQRHLQRATQENFLPDLLLVDGGKGQLAVAVKALAKHKLTGRIDLLGIAKEKEEEGEKIYAPGRKNPLNLARHSALLLLLMQIRDEAHRFGITFHRKLRLKNNLGSVLETVEGVGARKRDLLLKTFGSVRRVAEADSTKLAALQGIGPLLAAKIQDHLRRHFNMSGR